MSPSAAAALWQLPLALLRIVIGWHFLYEGWAKLTYPAWSSSSYLKFATGPFAEVFHSMGANDALVRVIDQLNIWGLILIGLALIAGAFTRFAAIAGIALLAMYYFAYPPFFGPVSGISEGQYLIVNKNLVELFALAVIVAFPAAPLGLDTFLAHRSRRRRERASAAVFRGPLPRREALMAMAGLPFLGGFVLALLNKHGWKSFEEIQLSARPHPNDVTVASATVKSFRFSSVRDLKGRLPMGKIGNVTLSRMILGGNLIGGWAHARDLIYVSKLVKAYHTRSKIFETFDLAESCGVNTVLTNPLLCDAINQYWRAGGKIQFISDCGGKDVLGLAQKSIDGGACACYVQGGVADDLVAKGDIDTIAKVLDLVRRNRLPAGIGAHKLETVKACLDRGLRPDFWMKTLHQVDYWSAKPQPEHDNIWCTNPEETIAFMENLPEPWIAFKILAAGAIEPQVGFRYAFESGADFICVGMYDFQIVDDVNLALDVLRSRITRRRQWCA